MSQPEREPTSRPELILLPNDECLDLLTRNDEAPSAEQVICSFAGLCSVEVSDHQPIPSSCIIKTAIKKSITH